MKPNNNKTKRASLIWTISPLVVGVLVFVASLLTEMYIFDGGFRPEMFLRSGGFDGGINTEHFYNSHAAIHDLARIYEIIISVCVLAIVYGIVGAIKSPKLKILPILGSIFAFLFLPFFVLGIVEATAWFLY